MKHNKYWFKPKRFGYGATPTSWEGWLVIFAFVIYLMSLTYMLEDGKIGEYFLYLILGLIVLMVISKKKSDGDWNWTWK